MRFVYWAFVKVDFKFKIQKQNFIQIYHCGFNTSHAIQSQFYFT